MAFCKIFDYFFLFLAFILAYFPLLCLCFSLCFSLLQRRLFSLFKDSDDVHLKIPPSNGLELRGLHNGIMQTIKGNREAQGLSFRYVVYSS
jgi:hypothetical protein